MRYEEGFRGFVGGLSKVENKVILVAVAILGYLLLLFIWLADAVSFIFRLVPRRAYKVMTGLVVGIISFVALWFTIYAVELLLDGLVYVAMGAMFFGMDNEIFQAARMAVNTALALYAAQRWGYHEGLDTFDRWFGPAQQRVDVR